MSLWQQELCQHPRIVAFDSGLTDQELDSLLSMQGYQGSLGYDFSTGASFDTDHRTSWTMFDHFNRFNHIRQHLLTRIEEVAGVEHQLNCAELLQLTRYEPGQYYRPHWDNFNLPNVKPIDNDRVATCVLYLNDDFAGGKTVMTNLGLAITPKRGYCLYFSYPDAAAVEKCLHSGEPVTEGMKKIANLWIRQHPIALGA